MSKEAFSLSRVTPLASLARGDAIHVVGVCGVAMAQMAVALAEMGYRVSGSDKEFYEPMAGVLRSSAVRTCQGFSPSNIPGDVKLVVIGNAVSYGNPEVNCVEERGLPYTLFTQVLYETVIAGRHSLVISGTHGKSTTTALLASVLYKAGLDPGYFIGAVARDLPHSLARGSGRFSAIEGDEYDSAFFAKVPKFTFYKPDTWVITSIEFDHADIYSDLASIERVFDEMMRGLPDTATALCCIEDASLRRLVPEWRKKTRCRVVTYGLREESDYRLLSTMRDAKGQRLTWRSVKGRKEASFVLPLSGEYNALNSLAVLASIESAGLSAEELMPHLESFSGVKRRQEVRYDGAGVMLIEDFAHHPTAVRETLQGIRMRYPNARLWAVFEPRSNTSRRKVFQDEYLRAFGAANQVILCEVKARSVDSSENLMDVATLSDAISKSGVPSCALPDAAAIGARLLGEAKSGDVIVMMSNGSFGGLPQIMEEGLTKKFG